jgi:polygalacturonase
MMPVWCARRRIGNTDGVNLDSCRNALVENIWIQNSDDGVCIKSGGETTAERLCISRLCRVVS